MKPNEPETLLCLNKLTYKTQSPSEAHSAALISVSLTLSQILVHIARPKI